MTSSRRRLRAPELTGRAWLGTGGRDLSLAQLRGKIVILDFWTFCCINCLHVLDELRELEQRFADVLVIVGVHSPKFTHEADAVAVRLAVERYEISHPVLDDPNLKTWKAYGARAWPTLVVIDPEGYVVAQMSGEGHAHNLDILLRELIERHEAAGTLHRGSGPYQPPAPAPNALRFPSKAVWLPASDTLLVADAGHHSLAEIRPDGGLVRQIGSGQRGLTDGAADAARFAEPSGLCLLPGPVAATVGYDVVVADTVNHALRGVHLGSGTTYTVAGTGQQWRPLDPAPWFVPHAPAADSASSRTKPGADVGPTSFVARPHLDAASFAVEPAHATADVALSSPWDVAWHPGLAAVIVAMAGIHQLWAFDPGTGQIGVLAGTSHEGLVDGPADQAWFAQPSGLSIDATGRCWVADSEVSALRVLDPIGDDVLVSTIVGVGLFDFGHVDGPATQARFQHPLGVAALPGGVIAVADTYNGAVRLYDPATGNVTTLATGLAEPSGIIVDPRPGTERQILVVESAAHRITELEVTDQTGTIDGGALQTARPVTTLEAGPLLVAVRFSPAAGQKLDDRYGPPVEVDISSTPPDLIVAGAGSGQAFERQIEVRAGEGVLHVAARVASCDADGAVEFPACHLNAQDWGVPIIIGQTPGAGGQSLVLTLHG